MLGLLMRWLQRWWLAVLFAGLLVALAFPRLASAYHLEAGGRVLDDPDRLAGNLTGALGHLQKALVWDARNAHAYRLLARAYQAGEDWTAAVEAMTRYTELRPDNPLGHVELAQLYEAIEAAMATMCLFDLIAALPEARVEAPDLPLDTPFAEPDGPAWHSYVAATTFSLLPTASPRPTLFMHPPARVTYTLTLPAHPAILRFGLGLDPCSHDWPGDGATFEVFLNAERIFLEHVDKPMARQGWHERMVDLDPWAGEEIALALAVTPGPLAELSGDWAGWGTPQVVDARLPALETLHPRARALEEWQKAGVTVQDLLQLGEKAHKERRHGEALAWYERVLRIEQNDRLAWLKIGQVCQSGTKSDICNQFWAVNDQNQFVNSDFAFDGLGWSFTRREGAAYAMTTCPGVPGKTCAQVGIDTVTFPHGTSWTQCLFLEPGQEYRFSAWIKTDTEGEWIPLYFQGQRNGEPHGIKLAGSHTGAQDWIYLERDFVAPDFENHRACFHPLRLLAVGNAWFHSAELRQLGER